MKRPNLAQFKGFCALHKGLAEAVCMAQAFAELERARVTAYVLPIFAKYEFYTDLEAERGGQRERIANPDLLYLSQDEAQVRAYYDECDAAHRAHGFEGPKDHCPALVAANLLMDAQRALIEAGAGFLGFDANSVWGEKREQMLKLLLGACLKGGVA